MAKKKKQVKPERHDKHAPKETRERHDKHAPKEKAEVVESENADD